MILETPRNFVVDHKIIEGFVTGTLDYKLELVEGGAILKMLNLEVRAGFLKHSKPHGYCMIYKDGKPFSL